MLIISSFEHSTYLELAITDLEQRGIPQKDIYAVPLDKVSEERKIFDTIHQADGISLFDGAAILSSVFMLLGSIYGFVMKWGPIIWGLIGLLLGAVLGLLLDLFAGRLKRKLKGINSANKRRKTNQNSEVVLIIRCELEEARMIKQVLRDNFAFGIGELKV